MNSDNKKRKASEELENSSKQPKIEEKNELKRKLDQSDLEEPPRKFAKTMSSPNGLRVSLNKGQQSKGGLSTSKKLTIKFKAQPTLPPNYEEETWSKLKEAIRAVQSKQPVAYTLEELYRSVEDLVDHQMSDNLYKNLHKDCEDHTKQLLSFLLKESQTTSPERFLTTINTCWTDYCEQMLLIRGIFLCLDRKFVLQRSDLLSIWDMSLNLFAKNIISTTEIDDKLILGLLSSILADRRGETVDKILLKSLLRMLSSLQMYQTHFEKKFIEETQAFYAQESAKYLQEYQVSDFLKHFESRIEEESQRALTYLDITTRKALIHTVETVAIATHVQSLAEKGFDILMDGDRQEDLKRMYSLFQRVDSLNQLKDSWNGYIKKRGADLVMDEQNDKTMINSLLKFKLNLDTAMKNCFNQDESFAYSQKEAFVYFINLRQNTPAELLAKFVDSNMRVGKERRSFNESEMEELLDRVMDIFRFIHGKDVFEAFYKKDLAKRLLLNKCASEDAEKSMISKLKTECGANYTAKIEGMFKDMETSDDINNQFKESDVLRENPLPLESKVYVLTTGCWPTYQNIKCVLPVELVSYQQVFEKFYLGKYHGKRLVWQHSLSQANIKATFPKGKKEIGGSLFQALVLVLYSELPDDATLTYTEIQEKTGLETAELTRTLQSLCLSKVRVMIKEPAGGPNDKQMNPTDTFAINSKFVAKGFKININAAVQVKETKAEQKKTQETVFKDRQYQVDASIVRIMKTRKTLTHNQLMSELYNQLKFPAKPADLKKRIESLIERDYLERCTEDSNSYNYLA
eukprot:TRINITY_DN1448_c0_g1_i1.p1 TRINITY_DN1448_c0_g1~~TRINITY_DN1448_c0_g1_i1.p1  ORF type:complete len:802 (+),score=176.26 TRINITY_DN1448_c0_g1_i1:100-2505(+)